MEKRYAYVARKLTEEIAGGAYPVGAILPNEFDLAASFSVSRSTVRAALKELELLGMVSRRRNAGTRVESSTASGDFRAFGQTLSSIEEIQQFRSSTVREIRETREIVVDVDLARKLECGPGTRWLKISFLRYPPDEHAKAPICWTDVYIESTFAEGVRARLPTHDGIYGTLLEELSGRRLEEIDQTIRAVAIDENLAGDLQASAGSPALEFRRKYLLSPGTLAEVSISVHPADRFSYGMRLRRWRALQAER